MSITTSLVLKDYISVEAPSVVSLHSQKKQRLGSETTL